MLDQLLKCRRMNRVARLPKIAAALACRFSTFPPLRTRGSSASSRRVTRPRAIAPHAAVAAALECLQLIGVVRSRP